MISKQHVGVGIITQTIARGENKEAVTYKCKQNGKTNAARDHGDAIFYLDAGLLLKFVLFQRAVEGFHIMTTCGRGADLLN